MIHSSIIIVYVQVYDIVHYSVATGHAMLI